MVHTAKKMTLGLSVLDQSLARNPDQASVALQETLQMAQWCEQLGYQRFWVSEHHAFETIAGSAPEVLLAAIGAATSRIRIGSGGVMLPHYSPYKVAEVFSTLANLYPGRVDLGVGRAAGADPATGLALAADGRPKFERFPELLEMLSHYLWDKGATPLLSPRPPGKLPVWMLGSSADSAVLAGQRGLPYTLGLFINPQADPRWIAHYRRHFRPVAQGDRPYAMLAISVFCADSREHALACQLSYDLSLFRAFTGHSRDPFLTPQQALVYPLGLQEKAFIANRQCCRVAGTPGDVHQRVSELASLYDVDEIMAVTNTYFLDDRMRSFELLQQAFA